MKSKIGSFIMTTAAASVVLALSAFAADGVWKPATGAIQPPPAPLYQDAHNGVTRDGSLVWNPTKGKWYFYYTQANPEKIYESRIGIASVSPDGRTWAYVGHTTGYTGADVYTVNQWAPSAIFDNGVIHLYMSINGLKIHHLTSPSADGVNFTDLGIVSLNGALAIDPDVDKIGDTWYMYYKNQSDNKQHTWLASSPDLNNWTVVRSLITDVGHEAPNMFKAKGFYWLTVDAAPGGNKGTRIYRSITGIDGFTYMNTILDANNGTRIGDKNGAGHPYVLVQDDEPYIFYHSWYGTKEQTVVQVAKLVFENGTFTCDRNMPFNFTLHAPGANDQQY
jgi:hypothetical protein